MKTFLSSLKMPDYMNMTTVTLPRGLKHTDNKQNSNTKIK